MKWLFSALLLANIGLFMWVSWYKELGVEPARKPRPPVNAENMLPLTTPGLKLTPRPAGGDRLELLTPIEREALGNEKFCYTIGPFESREAALKAGAFMDELQLEYGTRAAEDKSESSYWVFIPPLATRQEAQAKVKELAKLGFKEHFITQEAGRDNAISLGVFGQRENAESQMAELKGKGIEAKLETRYRLRLLHWLNLRAADLTESQVDHLAQIEWGPAEIRVRQAACSGSPDKSAGRDGE
jgi:hypothetical protein